MWGMAQSERNSSNFSIANHHATKRVIRLKRLLTSDMRAHLLCYLVVTALSSHDLTKMWRVEHLVESNRIWLKRNRMLASWLERIMLGQLAMKLAREHIRGERLSAKIDVEMLFSSEMRLNYESPLVSHI